MSLLVIKIGRGLQSVCILSIPLWFSVPASFGLRFFFLCDEPSVFVLFLSRVSYYMLLGGFSDDHLYHVALIV